MADSDQSGPTDFTLTVWRSGESLSAMIECPAFVDQEDDMIDVADALRWADARCAHIDPMEADE